MRLFTRERTPWQSSDRIAPGAGVQSMSSTKPEPSATPTNIRERGGLSALFGPPPILPGESAEAWYELHAQMTAYVKPIGILEENWVREAVNYIWDDLRYGRLKQSLLAATAYQGLEEILEPLIGQPDAEVLAKRWAGREESAIEEVDE